MPEETPNAEPEGQPEAQPDAGAGSPDSGADGTSDPVAPSGEGQPGGTAGGGAGGESQPEPSPAEGGGQEVPESGGAEKAAPAEDAAPEVSNPTTSPAAGLPTGDVSKPSAASGSPKNEKPAGAALVDLGHEALDKAKEIARGTLKSALTESRDFVKTLLNNKDMSEAEKQEVTRLYRAAEKHALMGKVAVAHAMGKRLDNYVASSSKVLKSQKARASQKYLTGLLRLATGAVSTFFATFGTPLVEKLTDIGLKATDEFLQ